MKILHVMPFGIFTINYVNMFNEFDMDNHTFWLYDYSKAAEKERNINFVNDKNVRRIANKEYCSFEKEYDNHDIIVLQHIPENLELLNLIYKCYEKIPKPYILRPWGRDANRTSDIYLLDESIWSPVDKMKMWLIENSSCIVATRRIYGALEKLYHVKSRWVLLLNDLLSFNVTKSTVLNEINNHEKLHVLVGHRGTRTLCHLDIFDMIVPYIKNIGYVICPLSYGERDYIEKIDHIGKIKFGNKWMPIFEWMDTSTYMHFLNENIDVAIFGGQFEGGTTISTLAYMGKAVYLDERCEMAEVLDDLGVVYYKLKSKHDDITLETLSEEERENNRKKMEELCDVKRIYDQWMILINECYKNGRNK